MSSLIRNELKKIFHKKAIYIVLIIAVAFTVLNAVMTKIFDKSVAYVNDDVEFYKEQISEMEKNKIEDKELYLSLKTQLQVAELLQKYDRNSWQEYVINNKAYELISNMIHNEGNADYDKYKKQYDTLISKLQSDDWKAFANEELNDINKQLEQMAEQKEATQDKATLKSMEPQIQNLSNQKQVLQWRIAKDIPYGNSPKSQILEQWINNKQNLDMYKEEEKTKKLTYNDKYEKQNMEELIRLCEYDINQSLSDNINLSEFNNRANLASEADSELIQSFMSYGLFILIAVVIIAGTIVSEEFNKGTIKLLLVRPYKRVKILVAKFIACLVVLGFVYIFVALLQFIVGGFANGFGDYAGKVNIYSFKTNSVETISTFKYLVLTGLSILPQYLLLMTLAFSLSVLFVNSPIAIALPLLGMMGSEIINQIAYNVEKAKFLRFFVTPNWDLSIYQFGKLPEFEPISLAFSIAICLIYFAIMVVTSMVVFKKKEIKNI